MVKVDKTEKENNIAKERARLNKVFKAMTGDRLEIAKGLIDEAAFMRATLSEARDILNRDGILDLFEQGEQSFYREHPASKVYATFVNRYTVVCGKLLDILPPAALPQAKDELMGFIREAPKVAS